MSLNNNVLLKTDSYKLGHYNMYRDDTQVVVSYFEARTGAEFDNTVFFGLQYLIKKHLLGQVVTEEKIQEAKKIVDAHLGPNVFNEAGWRHILEKHNGRLPVRIRAVLEGSVIPVNNVLMVVENTDETVPWLTNYLETLLSHVWAPSTVATLSRECKIMFKDYLEETTDIMDGLSFQLHDFGGRGVSSNETAGICGLGHLVNFMGTDTVQAIVAGMEYYDSGVCAYSVPASEHSIMTSLGKEGEAEIFAELLEKYPTGILSVVIDSYDDIGFIKNIVAPHVTRIMGRDGKVVFRPDSVQEGSTPHETTLSIINALSDVFGHTINKKGFKELPPMIGMLWGDGLDYYAIEDILAHLETNGWSASNIVFGMGGGLLQKIHRDVQRFAFKCSAQKRGNEWFDICKEPRDESKKSKAGRLKLINIDGVYKTVRESEYLEHHDLLVTVYNNGELIVDQKFADIRKRAELT